MRAPRGTILSGKSAESALLSGQVCSNKFFDSTKFTENMPITHGEGPHVFHTGISR